MGRNHFSYEKRRRELEKKKKKEEKKLKKQEGDSDGGQIADEDTLKDLFFVPEEEDAEAQDEEE
ncbi:hypothetical protein [Marispirochaeta sp.]|uniref:hypothetical protein n=1 Tax=Marispirochaeta sp. TaxID=2038653 RepID=UPI0029C83010|nr:hypothetical protein [Marispirochaeta sp.]